MRIIILGGGNVGTSLARNLVEEDNDIVLIDRDQNHLNEIKQQIDIQTVCGLASNPSILREAGIEQADILIAVTPSDEVNMIACLIATNLFQTPKTIARIRSEDYYRYPKLFKKPNIPVQTLIHPAKLIMDHIVRLIEFPGVSQILSFFNDTICIITIENQTGDWIDGKPIADIKHKLLKTHATLIALFNKKESIPLTDNYVISPKDKLLFITPEKNIRLLLTALGRKVSPNRRIMIAGGGLIGQHLAKNLENRYQIKIIEKNPLYAAELASTLHHTTVLEGDIADRELLISENIKDIDVFCALTDDDEANIMGSLQAKYLGAKYAMTLVNHEGYVDLIEESLINYALSPQFITIGSILSKLRRGNMIKVHRLQEQEAEAIELIVEGVEKTSSVIGRPLNEIELPPHCIVAGIIRKKQLHTNPKLTIATKDHIILLLLKKKYIHQLEALFQVNLSFMS